jgi:glycosyltransferase involved in cell wall biosynthesis
MRVLSIGTDRKIFEEGSAACARQLAYAQKLGELDVVVLSRGESLAQFSEQTLSVYPTRSALRLTYVLGARRIARSLRRPDVVTVQDPFETGLIGLRIARMLGVPLHVQVHTDLTSPAFRRHSLMNRIRYHIAWYVLRRASRVRVILARTKDELVAAGITASIEVLPIFVDTQRYASLPREKHPRWKIDALYIGRLEPEKHPCLALDAVAAARTAGHDIGLTIVGEGSEHESLIQRAKHAGIESRVEFVGWQHDIGRYLARADVVLVPSRYEGYGLVIVEALAAGVPVIATDVGVAREAGAIVASERQFIPTFLKWLADGPRSASLVNYPYRNYMEYVEQWCADIKASGPDVS